MWNGVKKALWGGSKNDSLHIHQLNGEEETRNSKSRHSQDQWDETGNRFECLDKNIQQKKHGGENLRSPSLMFWRPTDDETKGAKAPASRKSSFSLWSQPSNGSVGDDEEVQREHIKRGNSSFLYWRNNSETEEKTPESDSNPKTTTRKSSSFLSWMPSSEYTTQEKKSETGDQSHISEEGKKTGKKHLRRTSSLLAKLRLGLVPLDVEETSTDTAPETEPAVSIGGEEEVKEQEYARRMSSLLAKLHPAVATPQAEEDEPNHMSPLPPAPEHAQNVARSPPRDHSQ